MSNLESDWKKLLALTDSGEDVITLNRDLQNAIVWADFRLVALSVYKQRRRGLDNKKHFRSELKQCLHYLNEALSLLETEDYEKYANFTTQVTQFFEKCGARDG